MCRPIYDPATTVRSGRRRRRAARSRATRFPRIGSTRLRGRSSSDIRCRRAPGPRTTIGASTTKRSIRTSSAARRPSAVPIAIRCSRRLTRFQETFIPVTPLPDGSGLTAGTLGPQDTRRGRLRPAISGRFRARCSTSFVSATRGGRSAALRPARRHASASLGLPGIPANAQFPNTLPTFLIGGYQQLGSPPNTASDFATSVTADRQFADVAERAAHLKIGRRPPLGAAERRAAAVADRFVHVQQPVHRPARRRRIPGTPFASFLLGQVQQFSIDLQEEEIRNRAHLPGVLRPGRLASVESRDGQRRPAIHAELSVDRKEQPGRGLQPRDTAARVPRAATASRGPPASFIRTTSVLASALSAASRTRPSLARAMGWSGSRWRASRRHSRRRSFRSCRPCRSARSTTSCRRSRWPAAPSVAPIPLTPNAGLGQGVFSVDRDLGSGYVQQWNASRAAGADVQPRRRGRLCRARRSRGSAFPTRT